MRRISAILFFILVVICCSSSAQSQAARQKAILVKRMIELNHYSPVAVEDSFSSDLFKKMINTVDPRRLLFTATEYDLLGGYKYKLDDELKGDGWRFLDLFTSVFKRSMTRADSIITVVLQKPFDFTTDETLLASNEGGYNFAATNNELYQRWAKYLKLEALEQLYDKITEDSTAKFSKETIMKLEPGIRDKRKALAKKRLKKMLEQSDGPENSLLKLYLNALAGGFDPHTNYFSPEEKEEFQSALSTEGLSFGLEFEENDKGKIIIDRLVPGGPAWKSGELNKGDELLELNAENKEPVDAGNMPLEEVYKILEGIGKDRLVIKVKKANGASRTVILRKEKIVNGDNIVRSFVLKGEKKVGYILLPGFYTEWENETGSGCANDVAKEIIKLKKEKIEGLIVDVRFNGGGSMSEGLEMTGIFVDEGPLAGQKNSKGKVAYYKDPNRGVIYEGPLALMVNGQSASASEMLAASLQDYNRAVIIGSTTYGKASVQQMFPLDTTFNANSNPPAGTTDVVKITIGKFYRLNGLSSQLKGVKPDVALPDAFDGLDIGERFYKNALAADSVQMNSYYKPLLPLPVNELARRSADRTRSNVDFQNIQKLAGAQPGAGKGGSMVIPLKWDSFEKWARQQKLKMEIVEGGSATRDKIFETFNNQLDWQWIQSNEDEKEINKQWLENIMEDIYIREAFLVVSDLINLQKPSSKN
jgi:carboxyl-terminal processing protease